MIAIVSLNSCVDRTLDAPDFEIGAHQRVRLLSETAAGKGTNVARALAALGAKVRLHGFVGEDMAPLFAKTLRASGVENRLLALSFRTRVNTTIVDPIRKTETHLREPGEPIAPETLDSLEKELLRASAPGGWIAFCGSLPPGLDPAAFGALLARFAKRGYFVAADASGPALGEAARAGVSLLKPNREELASLVGPETLERDGLAGAARALVAKAPNLTILASDGARGAILATPDGTWRGAAESPPEARKTVGAGDALLAGYLRGALANESPDARLRRAIATATASLTAPHAGELNSADLDTPVKIESVG